MQWRRPRGSPRPTRPGLLTRTQPEATSSRRARPRARPAKFSVPEPEAQGGPRVRRNGTPTHAGDSASRAAFNSNVGESPESTGPDQDHVHPHPTRRHRRQHLTSVRHLPSSSSFQPLEQHPRPHPRRPPPPPRQRRRTKAGRIKFQGGRVLTSITIRLRSAAFLGEDQIGEHPTSLLAVRPASLSIGRCFPLLLRLGVGLARPSVGERRRGVLGW